MSADLLDRIQAAADDLLARVDAVFTMHGAPADHPVWPAARRVGTTPAGAVAHFERLDAARLRDAAGRLRSVAGDFMTALAQTPKVAWAGASADAYAARNGAMHGFADHADDRMRATADHIDAVADWVNSSRDTIARNLAACVGSREAVLVRTGDEEQAATAAAEIAARVLSAVASCVDSGWDVHASGRGVLDTATWRGPDTGMTVRSDRIELR